MVVRGWEVLLFSKIGDKDVEIGGHGDIFVQFEQRTRNWNTFLKMLNFSK